ncbi:mannose-1-phosphate guanylyltransferase [Phenylobacterium koreense]|uniref:Mannose-1-phosphate guanylyltransferase/mannose-6-phosphate isomerase n=3 Tax=Phenylobacterium TaxID=20 RepID=A0ABV2EI41_9CAUL
MAEPSKIIPVLMSGGAGTRLWPLSRNAKPKQFHRLGGDNTLIQDTARRLTGEGFAAPIVICAARHADLAREQLVDAGVAPQALITEPAPRNTAPASVAAAAFGAEIDPEALMVLMHADNLVADVPALHAAIAAGRAAAEAGEIVLLGLKPTGPATIYGYIQAQGEGAVRKVASFVEKPDLATAQRFVADPNYTWNGGMFLFKAGAFLAEARRLAPEVAAAAEAAVKGAIRTGDVVALSETFVASPNIAIDVAVMEKTDKASVVEADIGWADVGNWGALWELSPRTENGDALDGDVTAVGTRNSLVRTDGPPVILAGVEDIVVVVENGVVMVTRRDAPTAVRDGVEALKAKGRTELL